MERNFDDALGGRGEFAPKIERLSAFNFRAAKSFLLSREKFCASLCEKFASISRASILRGCGDFFLVFFQNSVRAAVFARPDSLIFHAFDEDFFKSRGFFDFSDENFANLKNSVAKALRGRDFFGAAGGEFGGEVLKSALGKTPKTDWRYFLMERAQKGENLAIPQGFFARKCGMRDFRLLLPLQAAYEKAEVVPQNAEFCESSCKKRLSSAIEKGFLFAAFQGEVPVAKAGVNAISQNFTQIGGIWTEKAHRSKGLAAFLTQKVASEAQKAGKSPVLFVKKDNIAAIRAYQKAGFSAFGSYELCYF